MTISKFFSFLSPKLKEMPPIEVISEEEEVLEEIPTEDTVEDIIEDTIEEEYPIEDYVVETPKEEEEVKETQIETEVIKKVVYDPIEESDLDVSDLSKFLDNDWSKVGRSDGYYLHSAPFLKRKKISLVSEFQRLVEKRIDELKHERLSCLNMIIDLRDISPEFVEKIENRRQLCQSYIEDLHNEKMLSNTGNGLVRSVVSQYEVGWDQGMSDYLLDHNFLNPLKRL